MHWSEKPIDRPDLIGRHGNSPHDDVTKLPYGNYDYYHHADAFEALTSSGVTPGSTFTGHYDAPSFASLHEDGASSPTMRFLSPETAILTTTSTVSTLHTVLPHAAQNQSSPTKSGSDPSVATVTSTSSLPTNPTQGLIVSFAAEDPDDDKNPEAGGGGSGGETIDVHGNPTNPGGGGTYVPTTPVSPGGSGDNSNGGGGSGTDENMTVVGKRHGFDHVVQIGGVYYLSNGHGGIITNATFAANSDGSSTTTATQLPSTRFSNIPTIFTEDYTAAMPMTMIVSGSASSSRKTERDGRIFAITRLTMTKLAQRMLQPGKTFMAVVLRMSISSLPCSKLRMVNHFSNIAGTRHITTSREKTLEVFIRFY